MPARKVVLRMYSMQSEKNFTEFRASKAALEKNCIRRCRACEICDTCKKRFDDYRHFALNATQCWICYRSNQQGKNILLFCEVCEKKLTMDAFNESDIKFTRKLRGISKFTVLRCRNCHTCQSCGIPQTDKAFEGKTRIADIVKSCTAKYAKRTYHAMLSRRAR